MRSMVEGAPVRAPSRTVVRAKELRRTMTLPEVLLWRDLRRRAVAGARWRRQPPVGPYVLDFFCAEAKLALEVDGGVHDHPSQVLHDQSRDAWLRARGIVILRFPAREILDDARRLDVLDTIVAAADAPSTAFGGPPPPLRG